MSLGFNAIHPKLKRRRDRDRITDFIFVDWL
jgi:hypothetical protein